MVQHPYKTHSYTALLKYLYTGKLKYIKERAVYHSKKIDKKELYMLFSIIANIEINNHYQEH